jgi:hypothetical protein
MRLGVMPGGLPSLAWFAIAQSGIRLDALTGAGSSEIDNVFTDPPLAYRVEAAPDASLVLYQALMPVFGDADAVDRVAAIVRCARANGIGRILLDLRHVVCGASVSQLYDLAYRNGALQGLSRGWRYAFLSSPDDRSHDFLEVVFGNAGYNAKMFVDRGAALAWLVKDREPAICPYEMALFLAA